MQHSEPEELNVTTDFSCLLILQKDCVGFSFTRGIYGKDSQSRVSYHVLDLALLERTLDFENKNTMWVMSISDSIRIMRVSIFYATCIKLKTAKF